MTVTAENTSFTPPIFNLLGPGKKFQLGVTEYNNILESASQKIEMEKYSLHGIFFHCSEKFSQFFIDGEKFNVKNFTAVFEIYSMVWGIYYLRVYKLQDCKNNLSGYMGEYVIKHKIDLVILHNLEIFKGKDIKKFQQWVFQEALCSLDEVLTEEFVSILKHYLPNEQNICLALTYPRNHYNYPEADIFIGLMVPAETSFMCVGQHHQYQPLAVCGLRGINPQTAIIENIQGDFGKKRLKELKGWECLLVAAMEYNAFCLGIRTLVIRAAENHPYKDALCMRTDLGLRMNGTAKKMGFRKRYTKQGEPYYVKYLSDQADKTQEIVLPLPRIEGDC